MKKTNNTGPIVTAILVAMLTLTSLPHSASAAMLTRQLELGMSGSDVSALQTYLATDSTIYPEGLVTGYFGPLTKAAVTRLQARFGISQVGRVGPQTIAAIGDMANPIGGIGGDRTAPMISGVSVSPTNSSAMIMWNTDQPASASIYYDTATLRLTEGDSNNDITISGSSSLVHADLTTAHSVFLTGLQSNTTYNYLIYVRDGSGNVSVTWPTTFRTN